MQNTSLPGTIDSLLTLRRAHAPAGSAVALTPGEKVAVRLGTLAGPPNPRRAACSSCDGNPARAWPSHTAPMHPANPGSRRRCIRRENKTFPVEEVRGNISSMGHET